MTFIYFKANLFKCDNPNLPIFQFYDKYPPTYSSTQNAIYFLSMFNYSSILSNISRNIVFPNILSMVFINIVIPNDIGINCN